MITIHHAILHILDFHSGLTVFSEHELDCGSSSVFTFLSKHLEKLQKAVNGKSGSFYDDSPLKARLTAYTAGETEFVAFSADLAERTYAALAQSEDPQPLDVLVVDFTTDDIRMLALLLCDNKVGFTHQVVQEDSRVRNEIINHYAILPQPSQKIDEYALIQLDSLAILFNEKKRLVNGQEAFALSDQVLSCDAALSVKETLAAVRSVAEEIAENHGKSTLETVAKVKSRLAETAEISETLDLAALGRELFPASPLLQQEYAAELKNCGLPETVTLDRDFAVKSSRSHKIKTDTGIEVTFPADYFQNTEFIEFINNPNGTISIQLKNIGKIINK